MFSSPGDFGRYQGFQFFLHILSALCAGIHMMSLVTVAAVPDHRCFIPGLDSPNATNAFDSAALQLAIPHRDDVADSCTMFSQLADAANGTVVACTAGYVFDSTYYKSSRTIDWSLVCDRRWMGAIAQTIYMFGVFTGAVTLGGLADRIGRKAVFCWSALLQLLVGVAVAYVPEYFSFLVLRFVYGIFGSAGAYITGFVLSMELIGPTMRTACGIAFQAAFAVGVMLVALWGALIPDRQTLQAVYGLHALLLVAHWWVMDESPRWLWMQGRTTEAVRIVERGVRWNGRGVALDVEYYLGRAKTTASKQVETAAVGIGHLFRTPNLRAKTLNVCFCWFANSLVYYGLSLSTGKLNGNPFMILFLMGLVEMPSYVVIVLVLDRLGRRSITSTLMLAGGLCCIAATMITQGSTAATTVVMLGKLFIAGSFAVIYNYSAELFPTVVRNSAMGLGSMSARLSGALTPLIALLDSFDPTIPAVIFGVIALLSGVCVMLLPETMDQPMPQSIADGENFGKGDTCFAACLGRGRGETESRKEGGTNGEAVEMMEPKA